MGRYGDNLYSILILHSVDSDPFPYLMNNHERYIRVMPLNTTSFIEEKVNIEWEEIILHSWTTRVLDHLISNKKREKAQIHKSQV